MLYTIELLMGMLMGNKFVEYDYEAPFYDESRFHDKLGGHLDFMHKMIVGDLMAPSSKFILDAGTGTGRFAVWLAVKGFKVVGVDVSRGMLRVAKRKANVLRSDVDLVLADLHFLPFRNGAFDGVICVNVIDHLLFIRNFLNNVAYILKSGGFFIFNFSNILSLYLPVAIFINISGKALFKHGKIRSRWFTFREIRFMLRQAAFDIDNVRGCMIASPLPFGNRLMRIIEIINLSMKFSRLRFLAGSIFIRAEPLLGIKSTQHPYCACL